MIRLSKLADYAFVILTQMIRSKSDSVSAFELSEKTTLPQPTVAKILKMLNKTKVVASTRGAAGGYSLVSKPEEITVTQIIEAVDGPITLTACLDSEETDCAAKNFCTLHQGWSKINMAVKSALNNVTLADIAEMSYTIPAIFTQDNSNKEAITSLSAASGEGGDNTE